MIGNYATNMTDKTSNNTNHVAVLMKGGSDGSTVVPTVVPTVASSSDRGCNGATAKQCVVTDTESGAPGIVAYDSDSNRDQQIAVFIKFLSDNFSKNDVSEMTITYRKKTDYSIVHYIQSLVNDSEFWINNALMACAVSIVFGYIWFNSI
jgi:hypothetical protein